jgi:hypothetical protein
MHFESSLIWLKRSLIFSERDLQLYYTILQSEGKLGLLTLLPPSFLYDHKKLGSYVMGLSLMFVCRQNSFCTITLVLVDDHSEFLTQRFLILSQNSESWYWFGVL